MTKGPGFKAAGLAMACKLIEIAHDRWRAVDEGYLPAPNASGAPAASGALGPLRAARSQCVRGSGPGGPLLGSVQLATRLGGVRLFSVISNSSSSATIVTVSDIAQKELRNNVGEVLRRAEAGETLTVTVAGRPVAELGPAHRRRWVSGAALAGIWRARAPRGLDADLEGLPAGVVDPFAS